MGEAHSDELREVYEQLLHDSSLSGRFVALDNGQRAHVVEKGDGPTLLVLHGTGNSALFLLPMLEALDGAKVIAVDRPGYGLSDAADLPQANYREAAVAWLDQLLDTLGLEAVTLVGHSMGGVWSIWYSLAHDARVERLVLMGGPPLLPGTRIPVPFRLMATPLLGDLLQALPSNRGAVMQFARGVGEGDTLPAYPGLLDLLVALNDDSLSAETALAETRTIIAPYALVSSQGWRDERRVLPRELSQLTMPTLIVWGDHEPVGTVSAAGKLATMIPDAQLEVLPCGHGPWLSEPERSAELVMNFVA